MKSRFIYLALMIFVSKMICSQSLKEHFVVEVQIDNSWGLNLKKNNTYVFYHWSGIADQTCTLDSGTYKISKDIITFYSIKKKNCSTSNRAFDGKTYYIRKIAYKKVLSGFYIHSAKKPLRKKVKILTSN